MRNALTWLLWLATVACGPIDPEGPVDADGNPVPQPAPGEAWLEVKEILPAPGDIPARPIITLRLSHYIDDDLLLDVDVVSLASGGRRAFGRAAWDVQTQTVTWQPIGSLIDGLEYELVLNPGRLESVVGSPLRAQPRVKWRVDATLPAPTTQPPPRVSWSEVEAVFARKCWSCHQDPQWRLNPLTVSSMVGVRAHDVDAYLVLPRDPDDSYLVHKILEDYPLIRWDVQPPSWSGAEPLEPVEIQTIIAWIRGLTGSDLDALP